MKAIVVHNTGTPDVLKCEEIATPRLRPNDVLVRVAACGVCFHDIVCRNGTMKYGVKLPIVPGHEVSGVIEAVGPQVQDFRAGDRVATVSQRFTCGQCRSCRAGLENLCERKEVLGDLELNGGYAELVAVDARAVAKVPDSVALDAAAIVGCAICCQLNAVRDIGRVTMGENVLVTGAGGGVGIHGVQLARHAGGRVIAVTSSQSKAAHIREAGAHDVLIVERGEEFSKRLIALTDGRGIDVVIDNVGTPVFTSIRRSLAASGRWILVGQVNGDFVQFNPAQLFLRGISMLSATGARKSQLDDALELVRRGELKPVVHEVVPMTEAARAHSIMEQAAPTGRILLKGFG